MKTNKLIGPALDWAVAKCEGMRITGETHDRHWLEGVVAAPCYLINYKPSSEWSVAGPIIERELISVNAYDGSGPKDRVWEAHMPNNIPYTKEEEITGPTPLIAAMRCYVAYKLGDEIDVPPELTKE